MSAHIKPAEEVAFTTGSTPESDPEKATVQRHEWASHDSPGLKLHDQSRVDKELAQYVSDVRVEISPERNAKLRHMIDRRVLTISIGVCLLQALTQSALPFASIMGLIQDTGMVGANGRVSQEYSWLPTCLNLTMLVFEYPQAYILSKVPIAKYLGLMIILEGVIIACHAACNSFAGLLIVRGFLGIFEAACQPCLILLSAMWYRREEQTVRVTIWYTMTGVQQIVGGLLAYCFSLINHGPLHSWQWWFLFFGIVSVLFGAFVLYWLPDSPMRAKCFSEEDKRDMIERVRDNQTGIQNRTFKTSQMVEALLDPQTWAHCLVSLCTTLPTAGLASFANIIIKSFGFTTLETQLLTMPVGLYLVILLLTTAWIVKKTDQTILIMSFFCLPAIVGTVLLMVLPDDTKSHRVGLLVCYYFTFSFWSVQTLNLSLISRNIAGQTKKTVVIASTLIAWAVGNSVGPQIFLAWDGPRYFIAFATHLGCYSLLILVTQGLRWYLVAQNKARDEIASAGVEEANDEDMVRAWEDLTDKENLSFRYVY